MVSCDDLFKIFKKNDLTFFTGIPDSTFKGWMRFLADESGKKLTHIVACNECEAVAISAGYHLSTGKIAVVYMQNSGCGKVVNPLISLCDPEVYSIPVILMIGWRGEPGKKDEPQHKKMGRITIPLLKTLEIPYKILTGNTKEAERAIAEIKEIAERRNCPAAILVKKGIIESYNTDEAENKTLEMKREDAIKLIIDNLDGSEIIVSTTGKTSRELFEYRMKRGETPADFYTVGGMGCAASIALGIALEKPGREIFVFDGDAAAIMQMGALATIGHYKPENFTHIIFDNKSHDSTGGQMTVSSTIDFEKVAKACGYGFVKSVESGKDLKDALGDVKSFKGPRMIIVNVNKGGRADLGRPTTTPVENKKEFVKFVAME